MNVAIVILNYNGQKYLEQFLPSVLEHSGENVAIYIADNASTDHSISWLKQYYPLIPIIELKENFGFAGGYNEALKRIQAKYYILLNSDIEVTPNWISPIINKLEADSTIAAAQPKIKAFNQRTHFEYAGAAGGWVDFMGYPFCRGRIFDVNEKDEGQYEEPHAIFWASGAALFIRAELFHQIGGFDADYFAHSEEIDLCWRLQRAGYQIMCYPESVIYHVGGGTLNYQNAFKTYLNFRNSLFTLLKNESILKLIWLIPARLILDGVAGILFITQGKYDHVKSILKAHGSFYNYFGRTLKSRRYFNALVKSNRVAKSKLSGRYLGSIVFQFYIVKKKYFKDLNIKSTQSKTK